MEKKIGIVTVLYNSGSVLKDFFESLNQQTFSHFVLYVVDNNSTDDSLDIARTCSERVDFLTKIYPQEKNWGVAKGNNIGIEAALSDKCDYILLSNNDIELNNNAIETLLNGLIRNDCSMAVSKVYYFDKPKVIWMAGGRINKRDASAVHFGDETEDRGQFDHDKEIEYAPTCFMLVKSEVFSKVGLMDESYFVYYDDTDFVWRAVKNNNVKLFYIFESQIYHKVSSSTGGGLSDFSIRFMSRNRIYFMRKHFGRMHRCFAYCYILIRYIIRDRWELNRKQRSIFTRGCIEGLHLSLS